MNLRELLTTNLIEKIPTDAKSVQSKIWLAERDIRSSQKIIAMNDPDTVDTAYITAYNAILQAGYALMFSRGYRVKARIRSHAVVQQFVESEFSKDFDDIMLTFGYARQTRHTLQYNTINIVSYSNAVELVEKAEFFVRRTKEILETHS